MDRMGYPLVFLSCVVLLAGCNAVTRGVVRANDSFQRGVYKSAQRVQHWTNHEEYEQEQAKVPQTGYCYQSLGDIVCYDYPQPDMTNKLLGYQGAAPEYAAPAMAVASAAPQQVIPQEPQPPMASAPFAMVKASEIAPVKAGGVASRDLAAPTKTQSAVQTVGEPAVLMPRN